MTEVKYPHIEVELSGQDGNAFFILGRVIKELKRGGVPPEEIEQFKAEATSGDYDHLLGVVQQWVTAS